MEHTDLTEQQYQVLSALGAAPIPLDAAALGKKLPFIDAPNQRVVLNKLFRLELVERTDTGKGYIYELSNSGQALISQRAQSLDDAIAASGGIGVDFTAGPDTSVEVVKFPGIDEVMRAGSLDHLITELNYEPPRPDGLDDDLADLERLAEGLKPRFPDVADGLERLRTYLEDAYPKTGS